MKKTLLFLSILFSIANHSYALDYFNTKADLGLQNPGTWSSTIDGTGSSPLSFSDPNQTFIISDQPKAHYSGFWAVSGFNSKVVVGTLTSPVAFTILPGADYISSTTLIEVSSNSSLIIKNNIIPQFSAGNLTTIDFAQTGTGPTDVITIPLTTYFNLKLSGGLKYFQSGNTRVNNDFTADGVVNMNGIGPRTSQNYKLTIMGSANFINGTTFDVGPSANNYRISLWFGETGDLPITHHLNSSTTELRLEGLSNAGRGKTELSANTNIQFNSPIVSFMVCSYVFNIPTPRIITNGGLITFNDNTYFFATEPYSILSNGTSFKFNGPAAFPGSFVDHCMAKIGFAPGSSIGDLTMTPPSNLDSILILNDVKITGNLNMTNGKIILSTGVKLELASTATVSTPINANSFIDGEIIRSGSTAISIPIGNYKLNKFAPLDFSNYSSTNTYDILYYPSGYPDRSIDPLTLNVYPSYNVGAQEYWDIIPTLPTGTVDINFHYNDVASEVHIPSTLRVARYNGTDWVDLGGTPGPASTTINGSVQVTNISSFGPFTFAAAIGGVIPVKLINFSARKQSSSVQLLWSTGQETNSRSFIIQKSGDGISWADLITVPAAGNSIVRKDYTANDFTPFNGFNYYRLKTVDMDNRSTLSLVKTVNFTSNSAIIMRQELSGAAISIYIPQENLPATISMYDAEGKLVGRSLATETLTKTNTGSQPKGIYVLKINGQHLQESKKIVIN